MLNKRNFIFIIYIKTKGIRIPAAVPFNTVFELIDAAEDLIIIFGKVIRPLKKYLNNNVLKGIIRVFSEFKTCGSFDFINIDVKEQVKIKICLR